MKKDNGFSCHDGVDAVCATSVAQTKQPKDSTELVMNDTVAAGSAMALIDADLEGEDTAEGGGLHKLLKSKFIEGSAGFMSLVALALVIGLAFCIERLIYLTLSEIDAKRLMQDIDAKLTEGDVEGAKELCRQTRGPVASICYQGLLHIKEPLEQIDRQLTNYGSVQIANMEKGCSWIKLFIAGSSLVGILRNGDWYGDGVRPDTDGWRHQSYHCGIGYEGGADNHYLRYHRGTDSATVLQLYPLENRTSDIADGRECHYVDGQRI